MEQAHSQLTIKKISSTIKLLSGLHIGAGNEAMEIGGLDQSVIKDPITHAPYIPGSSLKGKIRSLLEIRLDKTSENHKGEPGYPCKCGEDECPICLLFGVGGEPENKDIKALRVTRILFRDAFMAEEWLERHKTGKLTTEIKYENIINRIKGIAEHPRPLERVPAGVEFDLNISIKVFADDDETRLTETLFAGMAMLELDALGGSGSRGSGQIQFTYLDVDGKKYSTPGEVNDKLTQALKNLT